MQLCVRFLIVLYLHNCIKCASLVLGFGVFFPSQTYRLKICTLLEDIVYLLKLLAHMKEHRSDLLLRQRKSRPVNLSSHGADV